MKQALALLAITSLLMIAPVVSRAESAPQMLDAYLSNLVPLGFSGNVVVAQHGKILLQKGYGLANRDRGVPVTTETVMTVGSISKQFTAAAILKLEMQHKLKLTDSISNYLPSVPSDKSGITIHELLTHTAGLAPDYGTSDYEKIGRDAYVERVMSAPLQSKPGTQFAYSNAGYNLAAAIVERVSGKTYESFLHEYIFTPAGMSNTGFHFPQWTPDQVAVGYQGDGTAWGTMPSHWKPDGPYWNQIGSGGIQSTPYDMYLWQVALLQNKVLSAAERAKFETGYVQSGPDERYAYGWGIVKSPYGLLVTHNGGNGVFFADFLRYLDRDTVIYIASNEATVPATMLGRRLARIAFGDPVVMPPAAIQLPAPALEGRSGTYRSSSGQELRVSSDGSNLLLQTSDPTLFSMLSPPLPDPLASDVVNKTNAFIKNGGPTDDGDHPNWQKLVSALGPLKSATILGSVAEREDPGVWLLARFQNAPKYVELLWSQDGLDGVASSEDPPTFSYHAESARQFFSYNVVRATINRVMFGDDGSLTIETPNKQLQLARKE